VNIYVNGQPREVEQTSPLLAVLEVPAGGAAPRGIAVALDGTVVPRARLGETVLHEGAKVEIVTAVQGG
jgi:sulfur carrier protein